MFPSGEKGPSCKQTSSSSRAPHPGPPARAPSTQSPTSLLAHGGARASSASCFSEAPGPQSDCTHLGGLTAKDLILRCPEVFKPFHLW